MAKPKYKSRFVDDYKFDAGEVVYYIGALFEKYIGLDGVVKRRSRKRNVNHYQIWFEDLQTEREFMEKFLNCKKESEVVDEN